MSKLMCCLIQGVIGFMALLLMIGAIPFIVGLVAGTWFFDEIMDRI